MFSLFKKKHETNKTKKMDSSVLNLFFQSLEKAPEYKDEKEEALKGVESELREFFDKKIIDFLLKENIFKKDEQKKEIEKIIHLKNTLWEILSKRWIYNKKKIAVIGRYSAGKSTLINLLLKEELLLEDSEPTTAIPTYIAKLNLKNKNENAIISCNLTYGTRVVSADILKKLSKNELEKFPIHFSEIVNYIAIDRTVISDNILIIDTPGYDSSDKKLFNKDKVIMEKVLEIVDYVIWVMDIADGDINKDSLEILKNIKKKFMIVLSKADQISLKEQKEILNQVEKTLKEEHINNCEKIISIGKGDEYYKKIEELKDFLRKWSQETNSDIDDIFEHIINILDEYYDSLNKKENSLRKINEHIKEIIRKKNEIEKLFEVERKKITFELESLLKELGSELKSLYEKIKSLVEQSYLETLVKQSDIEPLVKQSDLEILVNSDLEALAKRSDFEALIKQSYFLMRKLEKLKDLNFFSEIRELIQSFENLFSFFYYKRHFFLSNKYIILESKWGEFKDALEKLVLNSQKLFFLIGEFMGEIEQYGNMVKNNLEEIDNFLSEIISAKKSIQKIENSLNQI